MKTSPDIRAGGDHGTAVRTFLIADIRGYSTFTRERGHAEAARLAAKFVDLAGDAIEAHGGRIVEIRGDEVLAVFGSAVSAVRAGVDLELACAEESARDSNLLVPAGVGIDQGESVREGEHYHGSSLNLAARLCSVASAGEVLVSRTLAELVSAEPDLELQDRGSLAFKGFDASVEVVTITPRHRPVPPVVVLEPPSLPAELDPLTPMVGRERELHWLRGTWRQVRRGQGRVVFVSGPHGIGKTRLAAALAGQVARMGGIVQYAGPGGTATADALTRVREASEVTSPTLMVLDDLDTAGEAPVKALEEASVAFAARPVMVLALITDHDSNADLSIVISRADREGTGHRVLAPLGLDEVGAIAGLYAGEDTAAVPMESVLRASAGVPGRVHEVMSEWARTEATRRLSAAAEYLAAGQTRRSADLEFANNVIGLKLGRLYEVEGTDEPIPLRQCPYKGLASFEGTDAANFFGRDRLVGELAARTVQFGLLGVVGDSGSGKSSVIAAGVLPSLRAGLLPGSNRWQQLTMRPGEHPMAELLSACRILIPDAGTDAFEQAIRSVGSQGRLVLFVDQFEELFTSSGDEAEATAFIEELTSAATRWSDRFVAIVALRGDFYGRCAQYPEFAVMLAANHVPVGPMNLDELRRAIELPARRVGLRVESSLIETLIEEVADEPGGLPLLSTGLVELWQNREDGWLRQGAFERSGGLRGAVARLAEGTYEQLSAAEQETARSIFLRLVGPGEGDAVTRRRAPIWEFDIDRDEVAARVLERLTRDRLLTTRTSTVEVAHEALLREWPRLRDWIEEDLQGHQLRQHLTQASQQWEASGREPSELYRGVRLSATLDWSALHARDLNDLERQFVDESRQSVEREAHRIRRTNRRLRGLLVGVAIFLVLALLAGSFAFVKQRQARSAATEAKHQATIALSRSLGASAFAQAQLDTALLLAAQGVRVNDSVQTESDLFATLLRSPHALGVFHVGTAGAGPQSIAISPDAHTLAVTTSDSNLWFYDASTRRPVGKPVPGISWLTSTVSGGSGAFLADGSQVAVRGDSEVQLVDVRSHEVVKTLVHDPRTCLALDVSLSPDGRTAYADTCSPTGNLGAFELRWDVPSGRRLPPVLLTADSSMDVPSVPAVASRSGDVVVLTPTRGGRIEIRRDRTLALDRWFKVPFPEAFFFLAVSPDGRTAAYVPQSTDKSVHFVDLRTGSVRIGEGGQGGPVIAFSSDGAALVTTSFTDNKMLVWDVATGTVKQTLNGHSGTIRSVAFDPQGQTLYSAGDDGNVFEWDVSGLRGFGRSFSTGSGSFSVGFQHVCPFLSASPDGKTVAVTEADHETDWTSVGGDVNLIDTATGQIKTTFPVAGKVPGVSSVCYAEFSPDGTRLLVSPAFASDGTVSLWALGEAEPRLIRTFSGLKAQNDQKRLFGSSPWATFSPDGKWVAGLDAEVIFGPGDKTTEWAHVREWDAATGDERAEPLQLKVETQSLVRNIAYSPNGRFLAANPGRDVLVIDSATLKVVHKFPVEGAPMFVAFSPKGGTLAAGTGNGKVLLWDTSTWKQVGSLQAASEAIATIAFDPAGQRLLTMTIGSARLWAMPSLRQIGTDLPWEFAHGAAGFAGRDSLTSIVLIQGAGKAFAYPASVEAWIGQACAIAGRNLTRAEWKLHVPDRPYQKTCPDL